MSYLAAANRLRTGDTISNAFAKMHAAFERIFIRDPSLRAEMDLIKRSFLFDPVWYREKYPTSKLYMGGAYLHYLRIGWKIGYSPGPGFNGQQYLQNNPDVAAAGDYNPLLHFIRHGAAEGRCLSLAQASVNQTHIEILAPADWEEVDAQPTLVIKSDIEIMAKVEYFDVASFFASPDEVLPEASVNTKLHPNNANLCKCPVSLDNKPYVVRVSCQKEILLLGIKVNYYKRYANNASAFTLAQRAIFEMQSEEIRSHCQTMMVKSRFIIVLDATESEKSRRTLNSLNAQVYTNWTFYEKRSGQDALQAGNWLIFLCEGDVLEPDLLYNYACRINIEILCDLVYCDSYQLHDRSAESQFYKPAWSPDYLEAFNYIERGAAFKIGDQTQLTESRSYVDFIMRFTEKNTAVAHVARVLIGLSLSPEAGFMAEGCHARRALEDRLVRTNRQGDVIPLAHAPSYFRIKIHPQNHPLVSIIIPTAGKTADIAGRDVDLVVNIVAAIRDDDYPNCEIIVVHNGDLSGGQLAALAKAKVRLVHFREREFNISKKLNLGAAHATGELLLLMNDDIEPLSSSWISSMVSHFEKPHVGIVGVKLLYPDGSVQHVGVVQNHGDCDHVCRGLSAHEDGYFGSASVVRNYSAVTGACVMVRKGIFRDVGGFNESLAISYNDVDFCFKVRALGLSVVCDASIQLCHFESLSRIPEVNMDELETFYRTWPRNLTADAFYNERMLDISPPSFAPLLKARML